MAGLRTNYKDDVLDVTQNTRRKYNMITNADGTVSFEDVTEYLTEGDSFGASDINATNMAIEHIGDCEFTNDTAPYSYKRSTHNAVYDKLVGISWVENQLVQNGNFASASGWSPTYGTATASGNILTYTITTVGDNKQNRIQRPREISLVEGHKYLVSATVKGKASTIYAVSYDSSNSRYAFDITLGTISDGVRTQISKVVTASNSGTFDIRFSVGYSNKAVNDVFEFSNIMLIDLTLMFGNPAIADKIYAMEQATVGSGLAWIRQYGFLNGIYEAFNVGTIESSAPTVRKVVGKNQLEVKDGYINTNQGITVTTFDDGSILLNGTNTSTSIPLPNMAKGPNSGGGGQNDGKKHFRPGSYYVYAGGARGVSIQICGSNSPAGSASDIVIFGRESARSLEIPEGYSSTWARLFIDANSSFDNVLIKPFIYFEDETDRTFEPYKEATYPLGGDILRGVPQLVGDDLVADGDVKTSDGVIAEKKMLVDLGSLTYTYDSTNQRFKSSNVSGMASIGIRTMQMLCPLYVAKVLESYDINWDMVFYNSADTLYIHDHRYTDPAAFKAALNGIYALIDKATPTSSVSTPFTSPQVSLVTEETDTICGHDSVVVDIPEWMQNEYFDDLRAQASKSDGVTRLYMSMSDYANITPSDFPNTEFSLWES